MSVNLSDKKYKAFFLKDLFPAVQRGKRLTKANHQEGNKPYISSTGSNNGVDGYISNDANVRCFNNCLTVANSGSVGSSFYQPFQFIASDHVTHLKNNEMSKYTYLFIASQVNRLSDKYNFNREINDKRITRENILLPVNSKNEPDWIFMDQYSKTIFEKKRKEYEQYARVSLLSLEYRHIAILKDKDWSAFFFDDIAIINSGKRLTKADIIPGATPFIGATSYNNGVTEFISNTNSSEDSNVLGVNYNGSVAENFYHPYRAIFSDDVKRISLKNIQGNKYLYLFLKSIILNQKSKYQYAYKLNEKRLKRQKVLLPISDDGLPDYAYMEQFMKNIEYIKLKEYLDYIS